MYRKERSAGGNNHKGGNNHGKNRAAIDIKLLVEIFTHVNAFIGNGRLDEKLHIWADGCAYKRYGREQIAATRTELRQDDLPANIAPQGMGGNVFRNKTKNTQIYTDKPTLFPPIRPL